MDIKHNTSYLFLNPLFSQFTVSLPVNLPTDNGYAERFVGIFKLAVAERYRYQSLGAFLQTAETWINFYNQLRPHEGLGNLSPQQFAEQFALEKIPSITLV